MTTEDNGALVRRTFEAWRDGTGQILDIFAPGMVWRIEGRSRIAKQYESTGQFVAEVLGPFGARFARGESFRPVTIRSVLSDGDTVVIVWDGEGIANDGVPYENSYTWIMRFENGKVVDGTAFFDSIALNELWDRVPAD